MVEFEEENQQMIVNDSVGEFLEHRDSVFCIDSFGEYVASGGGDNSAFIWRLADASIDGKIEGFSDSVVACRFSSCGSFLAAASMDGSCRVWSVAERCLLPFVLEGPSEVTDVAWHPRGPVLAAASLDGSTWMWSMPTGTLMNVFSDASVPISQVQFTPDGRALVCGREDGAVVVWNPRDATPIARHNRISKGGGVTAMNLSSEGAVAVVGFADGSLQVIDLLSANRVLSTLSIGEDSSIEAILRCKRMPWIVSASSDGTINVWELEHSAKRQTIQVGVGVSSLLWLDDWTFVAGCLDGVLRSWDCRSEEMQNEWRGHDDAILAITATCGAIISASDDSNALVFDAANKNV